MSNETRPWNDGDAPEGAHNFRDLGGILTKDGHRLKSRAFFRSGDLSGLLEQGRQKMRDLGIKAVFDLRDRTERTKRPYGWCGEDGIGHWSHDYEMSGASLRELLQMAVVPPERFREEMWLVYSELPFLLAPAYSALLAALADGEGPVVFGCTAGKDRTGFGAALLLSLLGTAPEEIVADYRATNRFIGELRRMAAHDLQTDADAENLQPLLMADPVYLDVSFDAIGQRCGSLENYCAEILSISDRHIARIRENLLEPLPN